MENILSQTASFIFFVQDNFMDIIEELIQRARDKYGDITPAGHCQTLEDSITIERGRVLLWFNVDNGSTKVEYTIIEGNYDIQGKTGY
jgi:hypothetical protein